MMKIMRQEADEQRSTVMMKDKMKGERRKGSVNIIAPPRRHSVADDPHPPAADVADVFLFLRFFALRRFVFFS